MDFKKKSLKTKGGIIGAIILPFTYIIPFLITQDPDFIVFILDPLSVPIWIIQWISFLIGGWILAIITTVLFFSLVGFLLGMLIGAIINKIKSKNG